MTIRDTWTRRRFLAAGSAVALVGFGAACGDDDGDPTAAVAPTTTSTTEPTDLPVNDEAQLTRLFDPMLEPIGQHVTRVGLYDLSEGFVSDDQGTHLAIYAEPIDPEGAGWDTTRYVEAIAQGMAAIAPFIFDTWPGIRTMDLCQEPPQAEAPEPEPPIVSQVVLGRADSELIDWETATLADLIAARLRSPQTARVRGSDDVEQHPLWVEAEERAVDLV